MRICRKVDRNFLFGKKIFHIYILSKRNNVDIKYFIFQIFISFFKYHFSMVRNKAKF